MKIFSSNYIGKIAVFSFFFVFLIFINTVSANHSGSPPDSSFGPALGTEGYDAAKNQQYWTQVKSYLESHNVPRVEASGYATRLKDYTKIARDRWWSSDFPPLEQKYKDTDGDGVSDLNDNCPNNSNADQLDTNENGIGNACDTVVTISDADSDGVADLADNCRNISNTNQLDTDGDLVGNECDACPNDNGHHTQASLDAGLCSNDPVVTPERTDSGAVVRGEQQRAQKDQGTIIPCDTNCTWADLYVLVKNIIDFCLFYLAIPLSVISIAVAGWLYLVAGFNESNKAKAKEILTGVLIGLCVALGAWLIVHFIVDALVKPEVAKTFPTEMGAGTTP